ncbi:MAG: hypothetical protein COU90_01275 [Candidatus Ryanbacteria bacterium CG10_big_fil_rev_8_21_14_0_10_43_42]|uniref:Uncharacterized protein n=1 Tax=Candidatus Ryanbacteria bacterium CG10_big_fil_rev_8_21_14_0_10_43_42 TaxID=1974864 RepID=A0A2M8KXQ1_9BACT|nr:MAG: hypothetical protein COU90_01275 [Candidatus Ryanbacteria bacterium CG10_big_fil_rev_8_21_14_0_10_43_42]
MPTVSYITKIKNTHLSGMLFSKNRKMEPITFPQYFLYSVVLFQHLREPSLRRSRRPEALPLGVWW